MCFFCYSYCELKVSISDEEIRAFIFDDKFKAKFCLFKEIICVV